jgi:hypothetical protein
MLVDRGHIERSPNYEQDYNYELTKEEMSLRTRQLLEERPPNGDDRYVCYEIEGDDPRFADVARTIERQVFEETFNEGTPEMKGNYGKYENQSIFFLSVDRDNMIPTGMLRVIESGPNGIKTLVDIAEAKDDPDYIRRVCEYYGMNEDLSDCWDWGTVAVPREFKGGSPLLFRSLYVASQKANIKHFVSIVDQKPYQMMELLGFPLTPLIETDWGPYLNSENSIRVHGYAQTFEARVLEYEASMPPEIRALAQVQSALSQLVHGTSDDAIQLLDRD